MYAYVFKIHVLIGLFIGAVAGSQSPAGNTGDFERLQALLSSGSGEWVAPNPGYQASQSNGIHEIMMRFHYDEERKLLTDTVTLRFKNQDYFSWISFWFFHPGLHGIQYTSYGPEGRYISGETFFSNDSTYITLEKFFEPDGSVKELKDENIIVSDKEIKNISYARRQGQWQETGTYIWKKV
jgi:hypothetical protein